MDSLFGELKRRNVFKVAIAYVILGWVVIQVTDVAVPALFLPDWVPSLVFYLGIIGFPFAMLFAWAFELTPEGLKRSREVTAEDSVAHETARKLEHLVVVLLVIALGFVAWDNYGGAPEDAAPATADTPVQAQAPVSAPAPIGKSIAVLPFANMSSDAEQEYFADGLSEELLNLLAKIPELKVAGRTSSFAFKGDNQDLRKIGAALNVATALEGSVRKSGTRLRITAQLINVEDGYHLWSETYDREMTDVFDMQDDIAAKIMAALNVHLGGTAPTRGRPTENMEAYEKFLSAKALTFTPDALGPLALLKEAVALDPDFAEAWEQLAVQYWVLGGGDLVSIEEGIDRTFQSASRALALDPSLVIAAAMRASSDRGNFTWAKEIAAFETALEHLPDNTAALYALSFDLIAAGYGAEVVPLMQRLVAIEPLAANAHEQLGVAYGVSGDTEAARAAWRKSAGLGNSFAAHHLFLDRMLAGDVEGAIGWFEENQRLVGRDPAPVAARIRAAADPVIGRQALSDWIATIPAEESPHLNRWWLYFAFGHMDDVFAELELMNADASIWSDLDVVFYVAQAYPGTGFTSDPRFLREAERIGVMDLWNTRGAPDNCAKETGDWVCE